MAKKKEFYEELPTKECPSCGEMCMEDATVCDGCGYRFVEEDMTEEETIDFDALFGSLDSNDEPEQVEEIEEIEDIEEIADTGDIEDIMELSDEELEEIGEMEDDISILSDEDDDISEELPSEDLLNSEDEADTPEDVLTCPNCGAEVGEDEVYCQACGYQLKEVEQEEPTAMLMGLDSYYQFANRDEVDYSSAIPGKETIVRFEDGKCIALMTLKEIPVKVVEVDEKEAEMLKADYQLKCQPELTIKEIVDAGYILKNSKKLLEKYYGTSDIDEVYGAGVSRYAGVKNTKEDLLKIGLSVEVLEILKDLKAKEQELLATVLTRLEATDLTMASAKCIVDSDRDEATMVDIVGREQMTRYVVNEILNQRLGQ